jgi:hypothetical protein
MLTISFPESILAYRDTTVIDCLIPALLPSDSGQVSSTHKPNDSLPEKNSAAVTFQDTGGANKTIAVC